MIREPVTIEMIMMSDSILILLVGKTGLGKSFLLYCAAKRAKDRDIDVLLIRANELFKLFFEHRLGEEVDLSYLHRAQLLLVDDIGTEPVTQNVSNEYFYLVIFLLYFMSLFWFISFHVVVFL